MSIPGFAPYYIYYVVFRKMTSGALGEDAGLESMLRFFRWMLVISLVLILVYYWKTGQIFSPALVLIVLISIIIIYGRFRKSSVERWLAEPGKRRVRP
jgi:hypothetical protein